MLYLFLINLNEVLVIFEQRSNKLFEFPKFELYANNEAIISSYLIHCHYVYSLKGTIENVGYR